MTDVPPVSPEPTPAAQQPPAYSQPSPGFAAAPPYPAGAPKKTPVLSIIALIAGIVGVLGSAAIGPIIFGIGAVVLGFLGRSREPASKGLWLTGIILGFVAIVLAIIFIVVYVVAAATLSDSTYN